MSPAAFDAPPPGAASCARTPSLAEALIVVNEALALLASAESAFTDVSSRERWRVHAERLRDEAVELGLARV